MRHHKGDGHIVPARRARGASYPQTVPLRIPDRNCLDSDATEPGNGGQSAKTRDKSASIGPRVRFTAAHPGRSTDAVRLVRALLRNMSGNRHHERQESMRGFISPRTKSSAPPPTAAPPQPAALSKPDRAPPGTQHLPQVHPDRSQALQRSCMTPRPIRRHPVSTGRPA